MIRKILLFICILFSASPAEALVLEKSTDKVDVFVIALNSDILIKFQMKDNWHIYGDTIGEVGMPTEIIWKPADLVKKVNQSQDKEFNFNDLKQFGYDNAAYYKFKALGNGRFKVKTHWLACNEEECAPESLDFEFDLPAISEKIWENENKKAEDSFPKIEVNLTIIIIMAFLGGITLNFMPCIFPILSLKAIYLVQNSHNHRKSKIEAVQYSLGVILSFIIISTTLIFLRNKGELIGWGFQLQSPAFVLIMAIVFLVISLMLIDVIKLNKSIVKYLGNQAFLTGLFAVLIASPCTAPFMGVAISYTLTKPAFIYYPIFIALGIGYALPFMLVGFFPKVLCKLLPKPGKWMLTLKKILALPVFATFIWLIWVFCEQVGINHEKDLEWREYNTSEVSEKIATGEPIFINFTAKWCLTCLFNEKTIFASEEFKRLDIVKYKADWTNQDEEITQTLETFNRASVPLYVACKSGTCKTLTQIPSVSEIKEFFK